MTEPWEFALRPQMAPDPEDVLRSMHEFIDWWESQKSIVLCRPEQAELLEDALKGEPLGGLFTVRASEWIPEGQAFVLNEQAMKAAVSHEVLHTPMPPGESLGIKLVNIGREEDGGHDRD